MIAEGRSACVTTGHGYAPKAFAEHPLGKGVKPLVFSFGGLGSGLAEQVARDVDQGEPSSFFWQFVGVGFDEYFDGFIAGMNFNTQRAALEIDFVTPSRFTANNRVGHLRSYERLKGWEVSRQAFDMFPLGWEYIALNGDCVWPAQPFGNAFRPVRNPRAEFLYAA
jgi:hypothetical protein